MLALGPDICCMARVRWIVRHRRAAAGCDGNGWSKSTFTKRPPLMFASTAETHKHDIRKGRAEKKRNFENWAVRAFLIESGCVMWSAVAALPSLISRISMKFQIVVLRHMTLTMGILRHFLPWWRKKTNFPPPAIPWFQRSLPARMQFFCCKPEVTCPMDSYVTAGCKSLLNTLAN